MINEVIKRLINGLKNVRFFTNFSFSFLRSKAIRCKNHKVEKEKTIFRFHEKSTNEFSIFASCLEEVNKENKFLSM